MRRPGLRTHLSQLAWRSPRLVLGTVSLAWNYLRELSGETAYQHYLRHQADRPGTLLSPQEFYRRRLEEKYSQPSRCC